MSIYKKYPNPGILSNTSIFKKYSNKSILF